MDAANYRSVRERKIRLAIGVVALMVILAGSVFLAFHGWGGHGG